MKQSDMPSQVTTDFNWLCPALGGSHCYGSSVPLAQANLFDESHERKAVPLTMVGDVESGIHLPNAAIRALFASPPTYDVRAPTGIHAQVYQLHILPTYPGWETDQRHINVHSH